MKSVMMKRIVRALVLWFGAMSLALAACGGGVGNGGIDSASAGLGGAVRSDGAGGAGGAALEAAAPEVAAAVDTNTVPVDAAEAPAAATCDELAAAARAQFASFVHSTSSLACLVDADCSDLFNRSLSCFAACGNPVRTADLSAVAKGAADVCDAYFGAGCPAKTPPCPRYVVFCDHGTCAAGVGPGAGSGATDAAVDSAPADAAAPDAFAAVDGGACTWPASFSASVDAGTVGCWASVNSNVCPVPPGDVVRPDGTILDPDGNPVANASCKYSCSASEYPLSCTGEPRPSGPPTIPAPDLSLGCRVLYQPMIANPYTETYCCPCGVGT